MFDLTLQLFGPFVSTLNDLPVEHYRSNKVQALLIYLVCEPGVTWRREALMTLLWPETPLESAQTNLRQIIYQLRRIIPEVQLRDNEGVVPLLISKRLTVKLNPAANIISDVARFDELLDVTKQHEHSDMATCPFCREHLDEAVRLYKGPFLADFYLDDSSEFEEWAHRRREAYRRQVRDALSVLAKGSLERGEYAQAREFAGRQLEIDNLDEHAYRQMMEALAREGRRREALSVYEEAVVLLRDELGMSPAGQTSRLARLIENDTLTASPVPLPPAARGYKLLNEIGAGAFGKVHRAYQPMVGREVAIKIILPRYANHPEFIRRFEAEAQIVARLEHPHIVPLYDYWREPDSAYLVMRWLRGGNLENLLAEGPLPAADTAHIVEQLAAALQTAHRQHVIHRDVKAANILLDEDQNAYLSDFGVATDLLSDEALLSRTGSSEFISPEQLLRKELSPQSDQYSLGMVIYYMLTGQSPLPSSLPFEEIRYTVLNDALPLVASRVPGIPRAVDDVIQKATAKKPNDRFANMIALSLAFQQAASAGHLFTIPGALAKTVALPADGEDVPNPYMGLRAFQESDAGTYFGREELMNQLLRRLSITDGEQSYQERFLALVGPSGSGKSSAVKAGLLPALRAGRAANSDKWFISEMTPGRHPLQELELALLRVAVDPPASLLEPLQRDSSGLIHVLERILPRDAGNETPQLLLLIDQFEELFTLTEEERECTLFLANLLAALHEADSKLRVVVTLRADFYDRPLQIPELGTLLKYRTEVILPLTPIELEQAISRPAALAGVSLEPGLMAAITADVVDRPGTLPLLQYALTELFERRENGTMTYATYQAVGGVSGALGRRADEIYAGLDEDGKKVAQQMFLRLVTLGEGVEDTRRRVLRSELEALIIPGGDMNHVIAAFGQYRLLGFDRDPATRGPTVEVAHEALLREWDQLRDWLDESRADVRLQRHLAVETSAWLQSGRDNSYLLRGTRLDQYDDWQERSLVGLTSEEQIFLSSSLAARERRAAEQEARRQHELDMAQQRAEEQAAVALSLRRRAIMLSILLLVAGLLAAAAVNFARSSSQNAGIAATRASEANTNAALAVENANVASTRQAEAAANAELAAAREAEALAEADSRAAAEANAAEQRDLALAREQEARESYSLALAANARQALEADDQPLALLLALAANTVDNPPLNAWRTLLDVAYAPGAIRQYQVGSPVNTVAISPNGQTMVSGSDDGIIRFWDMNSGEPLRTLHGHSDSVTDIVFSPDGTKALSGGGDNKALLWDVASGTIELELLGHDNPVSSVAFLPDGRHALTGEDTRQLHGTSILWNLETGQEVGRFGSDLEGQIEGVMSIAVSNDGQLALIGYRKGSALNTHTAALWNLETGELVRFLEGSDRDVNSVAFSHDGTLGFGASSDSLIHVWDVESGELNRSLNGHKSDVTSFVLGPNGFTALSGALDGEVILWDLSTWQPSARFHGHEDAVWGSRFLSDSTAVTASTDGTMRQWDLTGRWQLERWRDPDIPSDHLFQELKISPDGRYVLTGSQQRITAANPIVTLWDYETRTPIRHLGPIDSPIDSISFTPDSKQSVITHDDGTISIWDLETGQLRRSFASHAGYAFDVDVSSDGKFALSAGNDAEVIYQDLTSGEIISHLIGHFEGRGVLDVTFLPGDQQAISGGWEGTLIVWDLKTGQQVQRLTGLTSKVGGHLYTAGHDDPVVNAVVATKDGRHALSAANDRSLILWDLITGESLQRFTGHTQPVNSVALTPDETRALSVAADDAMILWDLSTGKAIRQFPLGQFDDAEFVPALDNHPSGQVALTTDADGSIIKWQLEEPVAAELIQWISYNRALRELTCLERESFQIEPLCSGETSLTNTAEMLTHVSQSVQSADSALTDVSSENPEEPAALPTPPERVPKIATLGENRGEITRGNFDIWLYEGHAGDVLSIRMAADRPLTDPTIPLEARFDAGILDTRLYIIQPDGSLLQRIDDVITADLDHLSDAHLEAVKLPVDGVYRIEARSALDSQAGGYTLYIDQIQPYWNAELFQDFIGHYIEGPWRYDTYIFIENNSLIQVFDYTGLGGSENIPLSDTEFISDIDGSLMRFTRDENGQVNGYEILVGLLQKDGGQWYYAERIGDLPPGFLEGRQNAP